MKLTSTNLAMIFALATIAIPMAGQTVAVTQVPRRDCGGPDKTDFITGQVKGASPGGHYVVIYSKACNGKLYVQPLADMPVTPLDASGKFRVSIHLGGTYYVLLARKENNSSYPAERADIPKAGGSILSVVEIPGRRAEGGSK